MGVPRLFKYVLDRHSNHIKQIPKDRLHTSVDNLYIDANAIIHNVAQVVWNYGQAKRILYQYKSMTPEEKTIKTYELFFEEIVLLTKTIRPTRILYIAIDGVAPVGKICQQRERRFLSSTKHTGTDFNSNSISPGTMFEFELIKYMNYAIRKQLTTTWKDITVIFSPPTVPGEGEHKIMDYIRSNSNRYNESHCMYGPDGDLIMLTLATHCPRFLLLRDDTFNSNKSLYYLLDIGNIANDIRTDMNCSETAINDFILIGFLVGNDFLPKVQMFHMLEHGLDTMICIYNDLRLKLSDEKGNVVMNNLATFIVKVSNLEYDELTSQATVNVPDPRFVNRTLLGCMRCGVLDIKAYKQAYYTKATVKDVNTMCSSYLRNFVWTFLYYVKGCPSFSEFYPYHYAPLMEDLANRTLYTSNIEFVKSEPLSPFQQLLCILPAKDKHILPPPYRKLMQSTSPLYKFYPSQFEIDYEGKLQEYQGTVLLPFVDVNLVKRYYSDIKPRYIYPRNEVSNVVKFSIGSKSHKFRSKYGTITSCVYTNAL